MTRHHDAVMLAWWGKNLYQLDREIARFALICRVRILDPGVIERVLQRDTGVCGTDNPVAFTKLHAMLMLHFVIREKSAGMVGQVQTAMIEAEIMDRLKATFPGMGELPSALRDAWPRFAGSSTAMAGNPSAEVHGAGQIDAALLS